MQTSPLTELLIGARESGKPLAVVDDQLVPAGTNAADAIQMAVAYRIGPVGGYKVFQVGTAEGVWGAIPAAHVLASPASVVSPGASFEVEIEIAFRFSRDLPARQDGQPYTRDDVQEAVGGAFPAIELIERRIPAVAAANPLIARADTLANWGLVTGVEAADWQSLVRPDLKLRLTVGDRTVVDQVGGHPSGDPAHALVWLANALALTDHPLKAGDVVTTGAFGGCHKIDPGEEAVASIEGFAPIRFSRLAG